MNKKFAHFVRSASFNLILTKGAIEILLSMYHWEESLKKENKNIKDYGFSIYEKINYLVNRGLIYNPDNLEYGNFCLTEAGILTCGILLQAGFHARKRTSEKIDL